MEVGLWEIVRSVNRSWIYDTYFSVYRAFHPGERSGEMSGGGMSGYHNNPQKWDIFNEILPIYLKIHSFQ